MMMGVLTRRGGGVVDEVLVLVLRGLGREVLGVGVGVVGGEEEDGGGDLKFSTVRDFLKPAIAIGMGCGDFDGIVDEVRSGLGGCHRLKTDETLFACVCPGVVPPLPFPFPGPPILGDPVVPSNCELALTILCTNPRPFNLVRLGVGAFCVWADVVVDLRNAGEGVVGCGIWGWRCLRPVGVGWMGRAREGTVMVAGAAGLGDEEEDEGDVGTALGAGEEEDVDNGRAGAV